MNIIYHVFKSIDSTNQYLKKLPEDRQTHVCRADMQSQGRGRFQRHWESPDSGNLYLSVRYPFSGNIADLNGFSLVVSLSLLKALKKSGISAPIFIKWPNDLLWQERKLAGILVESIPNAIIIGIGLNIATANQSGCCLSDISETSLDRAHIENILLKQLTEDFILFQQQGFVRFQSSWLEHHYLQNKAVIIHQPLGLLHGVVQGVSDQGHLILLDNNQQTHLISAGEASLSAQ
jgi:BirA family biotin operon repressor/biotin-[acetyl-CoA-carboxylase] ligase